MKIPKPSILFFGTPEFSLPTFNSLIKENYGIAGVITNPDEPAGRKQILTPPPLKVLAQRHKIPVFQPQALDIKNRVSDIPAATLYIVAAYGKILPKAIIELPKYGALNIHPSLLPRWRGPAPIQYAILRGDTETGVSIIKMDELMDHGPIIASSKFQSAGWRINSKITYPELHDKLAELGAELLIETLPGWLRGEITPIPQDDSKATYSKILKRDDGRIDWTRAAEELERLIRAFNPWPGTWSLLPAEKAIYRIRLEEAEVFPEEPPRGDYGYIWQSPTSPLLIKTGRGSIAVKRLNLSGKKSLTAINFLRGYPQIIGKTLI
jgi:methionyl-tRNA formyltransferase